MVDSLWFIKIKKLFHINSDDKLNALIRNKNEIHGSLRSGKEELENTSGFEWGNYKISFGSALQIDVHSYPYDSNFSFEIDLKDISTVELLELKVAFSSIDEYWNLWNYKNFEQCFNKFVAENEEYSGMNIEQVSQIIEHDWEQYEDISELENQMYYDDYWKIESLIRVNKMFNALDFFKKVE